MGNLLLAQTDLTPSVNFDIVSNIYEIKGQCMPEDAFDFFDKIMLWFKLHSADTNMKPFTLNIYMDYFNSASSKMLMNLFTDIAKYQQQGKAINIIWNCFEDDVDLIDAIEEYIEITSVKIETKFI
jgi:SiaC family regulatory phosphoprotein